MYIKKNIDGFRIDAECGNDKINQIFLTLNKVDEPKISFAHVDGYTIEQIKGLIEGLQKTIEIAENKGN